MEWPGQDIFEKRSGELKFDFLSLFVRREKIKMLNQSNIQNSH